MELIEQVISLALLETADLPDRAGGLARLSLLDWMTCGRAGAGEPLAEKLRHLASAEAGTGQASVIASGTAPARMAALVNGATSHALDYDDTHFAHVGHLSVAIYPAALAVAEQTDASASDLIAAFLVGAEAAIRIGLVLGRDHYNHGFHQTATAGAFGATLAAGRLYGLDAAQMRMAIGLCATRASGVKSQFGTMGKPYNAGIAAANGVECAALARLGFTSADDGLMGPQGFVPTHTAQPGAVPPWTGAFLFEDNKYKLHACCHGTHAMIEALLAVREAASIELEQVTALTLRTNPRWLQVCDIKQPRTGLEVKFSYGWLAGMALRGDATGDERSYTNACAADKGLAGFASRVTVAGDATIGDLQARGHITLADGRNIDISHDLAAPLAQDVLTEKLRRKSTAMIGDKGAELWDMLSQVERVDARRLGRWLRDESAPR